MNNMYLPIYFCGVNNSTNWQVRYGTYKKITNLMVYLNHVQYLMDIFNATKKTARNLKNSIKTI